MGKFSGLLALAITEAGQASEVGTIVELGAGAWGNFLHDNPPGRSQGLLGEGNEREC